MAATGERTAPGAVFSEAGELVNKVLIDLSQPIEPEMTVFPGDPKPHFRPADGVEEPWWVAEIKIGSATGTHFDFPRIYSPAERPLTSIPLRVSFFRGLFCQCRT
jgi:kynurenine formamidase